MKRILPEKRISLVMAVMAALTFSACTTYPIARDVKYVSFEEDVSKGKPVGPIRGEDCVWRLFGYALGGQPTLDRALASARTQTSASPTDVLGGKKDTFNSNALRYVTNLSTDQDGFNALIIGKYCFVVKGTGYK